ncbi:MAG: DUF3782 domain-containing protein, partial [Bacteroidetes bacterium]|nr:DUF3782 domain-containing protein [Bacteroidota bacterium]
KKREEDNKKWAEQEKKWAEQNKKWWEHHEEDKIKWEEHLKEDRKMWEEHLKEDKKKWQENQKNIENILKRIDDVQKKQEQSFGAIGARWGIHTEASFRNALKGILEDTHSGYNVINYNEFDEEGIVFDRPDQVEIDVIVKNGKTYIIEIKSSVSKADISVFIRKVRFFKKKHEQKVYKNIIVSPMIDENAREFAKSAGIKLYSYVENIDL